MLNPFWADSQAFILMAAVIYIIAIIFSKGVENQEELEETVNISLANLSKLKTGKVKAIRFSTLNSVCVALNCQPGDILEH